VPLDLAAFVVEAGAVPADAMERALARQREAGGSLDTALLELELLPVDELEQLLSRASGLPPGPGAALEPDPRARRVFPAKVAERHGLAPFRLEGRDLSLLATFPVDLAALDELSFMLSLHLVPHVAPEWRVRELQARLYGSPVPERLAAVAAAVRRAEGGRRAEAPPPSARAAAEAPPFALADPAAERAHDDELAISIDDGPPPPAEIEREPAFGIAPEMPLAAALAQAVEAAEAEVLRAAGARVPREEAPPRWTLDEASAALARARGRDEVVSVALRYAHDFFEAVALFAVMRDWVGGHDALGWASARERCRSTSARAADVGLFRTVLGTGGPYLGPVARGDGNEELVSALGRPWPHVALAYPVTLRDRIVAVLYADNGAAPVSPRRVGDLLLVLGALGGAFERILRDAKRARAGFAAVDEASAPRDEAGWEASEPGRLSAPPRRASRAEEGGYQVAPASEAFSLTAPFDAAAAVERLCRTAPRSEERARVLAQLARHGPDAAAALRAAFPGPVDRASRAAAQTTPIEERGPVLAALAALGPVATPYVAELLGDTDPEKRRLATLLAGRVGDPAAFLPLAERALDADPAVRAAALDALAGLRGDPDFRPVIERLRRAVVGADEERPADAALALARLGDAGSVPLLAQLLDAPDATAAAARAALETLTARRLGRDAQAWLSWWKAHRDSSRADWLFSALEEDDRDARATAAELLREAGRTPVRYAPDAPAPERVRAARAWRAFFDEQGYAV
jgi:hypothetical protein